MYFGYEIILNVREREEKNVEKMRKQREIKIKINKNSCCKMIRYVTRGEIKFN